MTRLDRYKRTMRRTRFFGIVGAALLIPAVCYDVSRVFGAILRYEGQIENSVMHGQLFIIVLAGLVGILALLRIAMLTIFIADAYIWISLSWLLLATTICAYISRSIPLIPIAHCNEQELCFGLYDQSYSYNSVNLIGCAFLILSLVRFLLTSAYILTRPRLV